MFTGFFVMSPKRKNMNALLHKETNTHRPINYLHMVTGQLSLQTVKELHLS